MSYEEFKKTGWLTFFTVVVGILPAISNFLGAIQSLSGFNNFPPELVREYPGLANFAVANTSSNLLSSVVACAIAVFFTIYLWKARTALREMTEDDQPVKLVEAQANIIKFVKLDTILQIIGLVFAVFVIIAVVGAVALFGSSFASR